MPILPSADGGVAGVPARSWKMSSPALRTMYTYMYVYTYIYIYLSLSVSLSLYIYSVTYMYMYVCIYTHKHIMICHYIIQYICHDICK